TYFARVSGDVGAQYGLVVTRGATIEQEPNGDRSTAQDITRPGVVLGSLSRRDSSSGSGLIRVAVVPANTSSDDPGFRSVVNQLNDDTYFTSQATLLTPAQIDTLAELSAYDVVVIGNNGFSGDNYGAATAALRSWVTAGGGIVDTGWGVYSAGNLTA